MQRYCMHITITISTICFYYHDYHCKIRVNIDTHINDDTIRTSYLPNWLSNQWAATCLLSVSRFLNFPYFSFFSFPFHFSISYLPFRIFPFFFFPCFFHFPSKIYSKNLPAAVAPEQTKGVLGKNHDRRSTF